MWVNLPFHRHENNLLSTSCTIWKKVVVMWKNKTYVLVSWMQEFRYKIHVFLFFYFSFCDFLSQSLSHHKNSMPRTRIIVKSRVKSWVLITSSWAYGHFPIPHTLPSFQMNLQMLQYVWKRTSLHPTSCNCDSTRIPSNQTVIQKPYPLRLQHLQEM